MKYRFTFKIILLLLFEANLSCHSSSKLRFQTDEVNTYEIEINKENLREINVKASLFMTMDTLFMDWEGASFLENGWAHFVEGMSLKNSSNKRIELIASSKGKWLIKKFEKAEQMQLEYTIRLEHDIIEWEEGGHDESAYVLDNSIFFTGSAVFITNSKAKKKNYSVSFVLPVDWSASTSLLKSNTSSNFSAKGLKELSKSIYFVGDITSVALDLNGLSIQLVAEKSNQSSLDLLAQISPPLSESLKAYFNGKGSNRFFCVVNVAPNSENIKPYFSGGAFPNAISLILPSHPDENLIPYIAYFYTHEFVHLWNGIAIEAKFPEHESWFIEGFTDYITMKTLKKLGFIDEDFFLNGLQGINDQYEKYRNKAGTISMRAAGLNKQENYDLVYSGGFITAFISEIDLVLSSDGNKSLKDFMQTLNASNGIEKKERYTIDNLITIMKSLAPSSGFEEIVKNQKRPIQKA